MKDFDKFLESNKKKDNKIKLFGQEWGIKHSFRETNEFLSVLKKDKSLEEDNEKMFLTMFSIAFEPELVKLIKDNLDSFDSNTIVAMIDTILELWGLPKLTDLYNAKKKTLNKIKES